MGSVAYFEDPAERLAVRVRDERASREQRKKVLGPELYRGPAWDILIGIYRAWSDDEHVTVSEACKFGGCPTTTALRKIQKLERYMLVKRVDDPNHRKRKYVQITAKGENALRHCFNREYSEVPRIAIHRGG